MKQVLHISFVLILQFSQTLVAQISPDKLQPFIGELTLITSSGPGITDTSGDILLVLKETNNEDEIILKLVRNHKGKLKLIGENNQLLMGQGLLGNSGGGSAELKENTIQIQYGIGSNSSFSKVSILFKKGMDSNYYFEELLSQSAEYGKEILTKRKFITEKETGKILFSEALESLIMVKSNPLTFSQLFSFEPETSTIEGKLMQKTFYGRPNFGQTPEKDEQILVFILQPNSPITLIAPIFQDDMENAYSTVRNISEIQLYSLEPSLNLKENLNKKIKITGRFIKAETSSHFTPILFQIDKLE